MLDASQLHKRWQMDLVPLLPASDRRPGICGSKPDMQQQQAFWPPSQVHLAQGQRAVLAAWGCGRTRLAVMCVVVVHEVRMGVAMLRYAELIVGQYWHG